MSKQSIFTSKKFQAEVKSANVTDGGLALKLIVPRTEMINIIPSLSECIGAVVDDELSKDLIFNSKANADEVKCIIELDIENKRFDSVHPKINIAKSEEHMLKQFRKASFIDVGIVDYSGTVPQVLISNETRLVDAYLYPELVEVLDEKR